MENAHAQIDEASMRQAVLEETKDPVRLRQAYYAVRVATCAQDPFKTLEMLLRPGRKDKEGDENAALALIAQHKTSPQRDIGQNWRSIFGQAIHAGMYRLAEAFAKQADFDPNHFCEPGIEWTALYCAIFKDDVRAASTVLRHPAFDPNVVCGGPGHRETVLGFAARNDLKDAKNVAKLVVEHPSTDLDAIAWKNMTARAVAAKFGKDWLVEMIDQERAKRGMAI